MSRASAKSQTRSRRSARTRRSASGSRAMVFTRRNYILLIAGIAVVLLGYILMRVENEVDGFLSLYVAPLLILGGYLEVIYAILWRPREARSEQPKPAA